MKKITIMMVLMLVLALSVPTFAAGHGSFSDVPSDHWAYDAINKLVAAGVVEGYPDGEYKGQQSMTRYEMAVMVSRALDNITNEMEAMSEGLTTGQAEDVTAIVESLMEKNSSDTLSDGQAEEVADIVDALTFELRAELKVLGADVDALGKDVDELEAKVDAMDVPEDNIEFGTDIATIFETGTYDVEDEALAVFFFEDGDAYDDDVYADKAFYQEIDFSVMGSVSGAEFNLAVDTITNYFSETNNVATSDSDDMVMDNALLEVSYNNMSAKLGDMEDYGAAKYFVDEEDVEGVEVTTDYMGYDIKTFVLGIDADPEIDDDLYGLTVSRSLDFGTVTGKLYHVRFGGANYVTHIAGELSDVVITDAVTMGAEAVFADANAAGLSDYLLTVNGEFVASDALTVTGMFETVGNEFVAYRDDLASALVDYNKAEVGATYTLDENNTVEGTVTYVMPGNDNYPPTAEDEMTVEASLENAYGDFTNEASVEYTMNDSFVKDVNIRIISLGTEYAWNESTTLGAGFTNKFWDLNGPEVSYNYLNGTMTKELNENMTWETEAFYLIGEDANDALTLGTDAEGHGMKTSLSVSF